MRLDEFSQQIEALQQRTAFLAGNRDSLPFKDLLETTFQELSTSLEELQVADMELRQQNELLLAIQDLLESERQRYRDLFELAPDGYLVTNTAGVIQEANRAAAQLLNTPAWGLVGKPFIVFVPEAERNAFRRRWAQLPQAPHQQQAHELRLHPRQRSPRDVSLTMTPIWNEQELVGWRCILRDITEQKQAEQELETYRHHLQAIVDEQTAELRQINAQLRQEIAERHQAEQALRQQTEREQLVHAIAQRIRQSLDLDAVLQTTTQEVRQFLQADRAIIVLFNEQGDGHIEAQSVAAGWSEIKHSMPPQSTFATYIDVYRQGGSRSVEDITRSPQILKPILNYMVPLKIRAFVTVPIMDDSTFLGLLSVQQCSGPRQWESFEITLLQQLATQVANAIRQSKLYQKVQRLNNDLDRQVQEKTIALQRALGFEATLKRITDRVRDSLDESQILQTAVEELTCVLRLRCCDTASYDLQQQTSTLKYCYGAQGYSSIFKQPLVQMADFAAGYRQLLQGQYFQFCELAPVVARQRCAILACPIFDNQGALGDLWLFHEPQRTFDELEIRLVQQVANQCAIAIRQARLFQAAENQVQELERLNQLKDDFLSTVSHELRTPVANMQMAIRMLQTNPNPERQQRYLEILQTECTREANLIKDLLDMQQLEAGSYPNFFMESLAVNEWLPVVIDPLRSRLQAHQQHLSFDLSDDLLITTDRFSLERILSELLNNACKYTPAGGEISLKIRLQSAEAMLSPAEARDSLVFIVQNQAEIPSAELPRIFEKFYRVPRLDPWQQGGTGLGLALVKKLAERLQGSITAESHSGWTRFTLKLPAQPSLSKTA